VDDPDGGAGNPVEQLGGEDSRAAYDSSPERLMVNCGSA
jgi:hypothetical protein